ncbi:DUF4349 domain-containing protein [bacterium]|nr:DUF4349 domain-containing protein [bacterium]
MTLSSGVDKKSSRMDLDYESSDEGYFGGRNAEAVGEMAPQSWAEEPLDAPAPPQPGAVTTDSTPAAGSHNNVISQALASAGIDESQIDGWAVPKAYAQDHGADEQYLVRTGDVNLEVDNYEEAQQKVAGIANSYGGFVSNSNSQKYADERTEGWIMIRVPADKFFQAWEDVRKIGNVQQESINTEDVSRQFLANHSQMKNLLAQQATLQEMLNEAVEIQRKHGLGEGRSLLLDVQERLFNVTSQLQAVEDRQNALSDQITKSTITARLTEVRKASETTQVKEEWNWGTARVREDAYRAMLGKFRNLWHGVIWFFYTAWSWIIPLVFWILVIWFVYRKWVRPWFVKQSKKVAKPAPKDAALKKPDDPAKK